MKQRVEHILISLTLLFMISSCLDTDGISEVELEEDQRFSRLDSIDLDKDGVYDFATDGFSAVSHAGSFHWVSMGCLHDNAYLYLDEGTTMHYSSLDTIISLYNTIETPDTTMHFYLKEYIDKNSCLPYESPHLVITENDGYWYHSEYPEDVDIESDRWKSKTEILYFVNSRTSEPSQFLPNVVDTFIQHKWQNIVGCNIIEKEESAYHYVKVSEGGNSVIGRLLLSRNDGNIITVESFEVIE